ncbi:MAG: calcium/sodium antiporter [Gammaproteobacteria bacterium]
MLIQIIAILAGFALLIWGADRFVIGASATARNLGVSPLLIGLTIVGFGTSAPEMLVSATASLNGNPGLAIGNAIGSNITNIALVLGLTAIIVPLRVESGIIKRELPILLLATLLAGSLLLDTNLSTLDGILLFTGLVVMLGWTVHLGLSSRKSDPVLEEYADEIPTDMPFSTSLFWLFAGLLVLVVSSRLLVWGSIGVATHFGVSDLIIGLTIVALGTSLPELAATIACAFKDEHDIAIGNIIGSNMFNLLAVLSMPGLIAPGPVDTAVITRDVPVMAVLTLALVIMARGVIKPGLINRLEGSILLLAYFGYQAMLYFSLTS